MSWAESYDIKEFIAGKLGAVKYRGLLVAIQ